LPPSLRIAADQSRGAVDAARLVIDQFNFQMGALVPKIEGHPSGRLKQTHE
jgi:hypothetical protein